LDDRPGSRACFDHLRAGDTLVVWRLDRLGRSLRHLIDTIAVLAERGVGFRCRQESIDTTTPGGRLIFHVVAATQRRVCSGARRDDAVFVCEDDGLDAVA